MILPDMEASAALGARIAAALQPGDVVTFSGPLGAGKTSIIRAILEALGHEGEVPSPSFALVQPYDELSPPILHADLYRLEDPEELLELGLENSNDAALLVEWPEHGGPDAFPDALALTLAIEPDGEARRLTWQVPLAWEGRWP